MTGGGKAGTGGGADRREGIALLAIAALALVNNVVNVLSIAADRAEEGLRPLGWELWLWETSSWIGLVLMLPIARRAARAFQPPRLPWAAAPLAHLPAGMLFSAGHVAVMIAIRQLGYRIAGERYDFFGDSPAGTLIYEFRKDILFYAVTVAILLLARRAVTAPTAPASPDRIEIRDGPRILWLAPGEIASIEAAGNYVELATAHGTILQRTTLSALEARLAPHDFVRIHRSRLIRRAAVREIRSTSSGDFEIVMQDGRTLAGSRRYRAALQL